MKLKPCFSKTKTRYHTITKHFCDGEKDCSAGQTSKLATNAAQQIDKPATLWCMSSTIDHRQSQQQPQNTSTLKWIKGISQLDAGDTHLCANIHATHNKFLLCARKSFANNLLQRRQHSWTLHHQSDEYIHHGLQGQMEWKKVEYCRFDIGF